MIAGRSGYDTDPCMCNVRAAPLPHMPCCTGKPAETAVAQIWGGCGGGQWGPAVADKSKAVGRRALKALPDTLGGSSLKRWHAGRSDKG